MSGQPIVYETLDKMGITYRKAEHRAIFQEMTLLPRKNICGRAIRSAKIFSCAMPRVTSIILW